MRLAEWGYPQSETRTKFLWGKSAPLMAKIAPVWRRAGHPRGPTRGGGSNVVGLPMPEIASPLYSFSGSADLGGMPAAR